MIDLYFFDTDCISTFLHIGRQDILVSLYNTRIHVPSFVYKELMHAPHIIISNFEEMKAFGNIIIDEITYGTEEAKLYTYLTKSAANNKRIGDGEAATIALAKYNNGVLASNNMKDISYYIDKYDLKHITTADILEKAVNDRIISIEDADSIWKEIMKNGDYMPDNSLSMYINRERK